MNKPNVLFIIPPSIPIDELKETNPNRQWATTCSIPLGILSIASYVRKHTDVNIDIVDFNLVIINNRDHLDKTGWDIFLSSCLARAGKRQRYDIIGISAIFNTNAGYLQPIASELKKLFPGSLVVTGGGFPTNLYSYVFDSSPDIDAVAIGEGEMPFLKLLQANDRESYLRNAVGWMTRERAARNESAQMDLLDKLDEIPTLEYDLVDFSQYQKLAHYHGNYTMGDVSISIMTSRGCPYLCNFCASHSVHGRKIRSHSAERVLTDLQKLKARYGVKIILIEDDNFLIDKKRALTILSGIERENLIIQFANGLSVMHIDEEIVDKLKAAGLDMATLAVESGSERVLKEIINKPYSNLAKVRKAVSLLRERGIYIRALFIIGFPGETKEEIMSSVRFMKEAGFNWMAIMIATPIAGSRLYEFCLKNNLLISGKLEYLNYGRCNIRLGHSSPEEIDELRYWINLEVNFVNNYDLKNGHPEIALIGFQDAIKRVPDHAFAHFFASKCYKMLSQDSLAQTSLDRYYSIIGESEYWARYSRSFGLSTDRLKDI